jgi:hypothetical protein
VVAIVCASSGCGPSVAPDGDRCDFVEREVGLDESIDGTTPREVAELLMRPVSGAVVWYGTGHTYVDVAGADGRAEFSAHAVFSGVSWVREPGPGQDLSTPERLYCSAQIIVDVVMEIETSDGALAETWTGHGEAQDGIASVTIEDPRPFAGKLAVVERPSAREWDRAELLTTLWFQAGPDGGTAMHGMMQYVLEELGDGEGAGSTETIAEFE